MVRMKSFRASLFPSLLLALLVLTTSCDVSPSMTYTPPFCQIVQFVGIVALSRSGFRYSVSHALEKIPCTLLKLETSSRRDFRACISFRSNSLSLCIGPS
jgi:hypothetical protein